MRAFFVDPIGRRLVDEVVPQAHDNAQIFSWAILQRLTGERLATALRFDNRKHWEAFINELPKPEKAWWNAGPVLTHERERSESVLLFIRLSSLGYDDSNSQANCCHANDYEYDELLKAKQVE